MKLKTSTKISLRVTTLTIIILCCFSFLIFFLFFNTRYYKQEDILLNDGEYKIPFFLRMIHEEENSESDTLKNTLEVSIDNNTDNELFETFENEIIDKTTKGFEFNETKEGNFSNTPHSPLKSGHNGFPPISISDNIKKGIVIFNISEIDGEISHLNGRSRFLSKLIPAELIYYNGKYYIYRNISDTEIKALDITAYILAQGELGQILVSRDIVFIIIIYLSSVYHVKNGLKKLKHLASYAENLNLDNLSLPFEIDKDAPEKDEIFLIGKAMNNALQRIDSQVSSLRDFISNASHELKTPLMMMNTEIDIGLKKKDYEQRLRNLKQSTKRIANLVDSLSLITKLESNVKFEKSLVNVSDICDTQINQILNIYPEAIIETEINDPELKKELHEGLFGIVIKNLVENACKYAGKDAIITIALNENECIVKDTGKGIDQESQKHLFERFWQVEKSEQGKHSFGLGLYLVKKIVGIHHRTISVKSEIGKGTSFIIKW